jgi:hypothetical protein
LKAATGIDIGERQAGLAKCSHEHIRIEIKNHAIRGFSGKQAEDLIRDLGATRRPNLSPSLNQSSPSQLS